MDLDGEELKATRKLHNCFKEKDILEDLEILYSTIYSNCKNEKELTKMQLEVSKISFKEVSKRKKELKDGVYK